MKPIRPSLKSSLMMVVLLFTASVFLIRTTQLISLKRQIGQRRLRVETLNKAGHGSPSIDKSLLQASVSDAAKVAGVKRLLNVGLLETRGPAQINIDWEGGLSSVGIIAALTKRQLIGRCQKIRLAAVDVTTVRFSATFAAPVAPGQDAPIAVATSRLVFRPVLGETREDPLLAQAREFKKQEEARLQEQRKETDAQKARELEERLRAKKEEMESDLSLTGIVNNGRETLAFINSRAAGGKTLMVRNGDKIHEATLTAIDEKAGQISLDYDGHFQLNLKIGAASTGVLQ